MGERILVTLIETLETAINLFSNTLSFMRVAAFSLNHVALALAVFTLAHGLGTAGHGITLVLGNIVIIVLEGGIVCDPGAAPDVLRGVLALFQRGWKGVRAVAN